VRTRDRDTPARSAAASSPSSSSPPVSRRLLPSFPPSQVHPKTVVVVLATALLFAIALFLFWQLQQIVRWVAIAVFLAVALAPAVNWLNRQRIPRVVAILLVYLALLLALAGLGALVIPPLVTQISEFVYTLVQLARQPGGVEQAIQQFADRFGLGDYVQGLLEQAAALPAQLSSAAGPLLALTRGVIGSVTAFVSILLITFFLLLDGERFVDTGINLLRAESRPRARRILVRASRAVHSYIFGNLAISLIAGIGAFVVMTIFQTPFALALALLVALFDLIPLVGATLAATIVILVGLSVSPFTGIVFLAYFIIYQQIENNVLQPLVYGRSVDLNPLVIFLAVLIGGQLLGILGALLAIPIAEIIRILISEWLDSRREAVEGAEQPESLPAATQDGPQNDATPSDTRQPEV
jgi:predicted PurR-regulated permease PerM